MRKILITGATGFVGKFVLNELFTKYERDDLCVLSSKNIDDLYTIPNNGYYFNSQYLKLHGCENVEILIHIGAFTPKSRADLDNMEKSNTNIINTERLLLSDLPKLKKIIYISTLDIYAPAKETISESTSTVPTTLYGWSKLYCEQMIQRFCEKRELTFEILRLGHIYGEGEERYKKVMPAMIENAVKGLDLTIYGDGNAIRTFIYIKDVARAIVKSICLEGSHIINIVGDEAITINGLSQLIAQISRKQLSIRHIYTNQENVNYIFDNSKMKEMLISELTPLRIGLSNEYQYMKNKLIILE